MDLKGDKNEVQLLDLNSAVPGFCNRSCHSFFNQLLQSYLLQLACSGHIHRVYHIVKNLSTVA